MKAQHARNIEYQPACHAPEVRSVYRAFFTTGFLYQGNLPDLRLLLLAWPRLLVDLAVLA